eukprot:2983442-Prymnesium_polylepis.1
MKRFQLRFRAVSDKDTFAKAQEVRAVFEHTMPCMLRLHSRNETAAHTSSPTKPRALDRKGSVGSIPLFDASKGSAMKSVARSPHKCSNRFAHSYAAAQLMARQAMTGNLTWLE